MAAFFEVLRDRVNSDPDTEGKLLSITLPAYYKHLKAFQLSRLEKVVDYFILDATNLHGQWDSGNQGNKWPAPECPNKWSIDAC